ncbi:uncharacterized protein BT62DRAFT_634175 [Guyanagaster necrorhizus]|uniref:Uncharacterized protein n=1 Tax=Guyanagaster necrorhizus TaxID=856835 RepID=A0A9P8AMW7_9AGAR|nr:uncharacterized protein BT62DRAFT_634175 [Guyanagaster necrorhizus MCA 3950]KAG7440272.1 hypothetical protein BT62DRAFT_634175 [Guyanagaster necrorhizus MCA 3950]
MGPPTFNLPVRLTSNGLTFAPGALESLSRQATPAPSFPFSSSSHSLAAAFRSSEPPSKRSRIDLDGRDVRHYTPMPVDEPILYHKEDRLIERMEREVSRKDRELERKDQELDQMREKMRAEKEGWLLLQGALEEDRNKSLQTRKREREAAEMEREKERAAVEMEREKERAAWRDAVEAWKQEREVLERANEDWKLKVDELRMEKDRLKAEMDNMMKKNDQDGVHLVDIARALQKMGTRLSPLKETEATAVNVHIS